uniref:Peptidase S1 domain-containing protein n=1 Tax=Panagrolaimus sp. JU765 TaxID=591449 RepID=A0AC34R3G0_9BILA
MLAIILLTLLAVSTAEDRIYNGKEAEPDLNNVVYLEASLLCTGTIISEHYILTAAHCLEPSTKSVKAITPDVHRNLPLFKEMKVAPPFFEADQWIVHPDYKDITTGNDIALIRVPTPMTIPPVPLAANYSHPKDDWLRVAGYGNTNYQVFNASTSNWTSFESPKMLMERKDGRFYQVGVNVHGFTSEFFSRLSSWKLPSQSPSAIASLSTDVSYYCPWIEETTGGEVKCQTFKSTPIVPKF